MRKFSIKIGQGRQQDHFQLYDSVSEFADRCALAPDYKLTNEYTWSDASKPWAGGHGMANAKLMLTNGQAALVERSDKFIAALEDQLPPPSARHAIVNDVSGFAPDVPAYLAGLPLSMRRKVKHENEAAPVSIVMNTGSSAAFSPEKVLERGLVALALARAVSSVRPVELWAGVSCAGENSRDTCNVYFRIDTAPMDLIRAAHLIADPSVSRVFCYGILRQDMNASSSIAWGRALDATDFHQTILRAFPDSANNGIVAMPVLHMDDEMTSDPVAWIKSKLAYLTGDTMAEVA